uniref:hypothetical protein n=1 Tax=uncultured Draconibacterium sp. TaxID=1573823 RepID=UPI0032169FDF
MKLLSRGIAPFLVLIIALTFILPAIDSGISEDLLLLASQKDNLKELTNRSEQLGFIYYIFKFDLYLEILSKIVGALSLLGLFYQFKKERNLEEAQFAMEISNNFLSNADLQEIYTILEASKNDRQKTNPFDVEDSLQVIKVANYLSFFEPIYDLIHRKIISIETVDQFSYRFFLVTNNRFVQEILLCKEGKDEAWRNIYKLHHEWKKFKKQKGQYEVWQCEFDLCREVNKGIYDKIIRS